MLWVLNHRLTKLWYSACYHNSIQQTFTSKSKMILKKLKHLKRMYDLIPYKWWRKKRYPGISVSKSMNRSISWFICTADRPGRTPPSPTGALCISKEHWQQDIFHKSLAVNLMEPVWIYSFTTEVHISREYSMHTNYVTKPNSSSKSPGIQPACGARLPL
jgi:hypothetical protein